MRKISVLVVDDISSLLAETRVPYLAKPLFAKQVDAAIQEFVKTLEPPGT